MGDGGSANDPGNRAQDTQRAARQDPAHRRRRAATPYAIPAGQPVRRRRARPRRRSGRSACAIRGGSRSIARPAISTSATSGRTRRRRSTGCRAGTGAGANLGWRVMEGYHCTGLGGAGRRATIPSLHAADPRVHACRGLLDHRRHRSIAAPRCRRSPGATCTPTSAAGHIWSAAPAPRGSWQSTRRARQRLADHARSARTRRASSTSPTTRRGPDPQARGRDRRSRRRDRVLQRGARPLLRHGHAGRDPRARRRRAARLAAHGRSRFRCYAAARTGLAPVCRFYLPPALGDSHFFSASAAECADVRAQASRRCIEESADAHVRVRCPIPSAARARRTAARCTAIWNARRGLEPPLHDRSRASATPWWREGGVAEGYGPDAVAICAPSDRVPRRAELTRRRRFGHNRRDLARQAGPCPKPPRAARRSNHGGPSMSLARTLTALAVGAHARRDRRARRHQHRRHAVRDRAGRVARHPGEEHDRAAADHDRRREDQLDRARRRLRHDQGRHQHAQAHHRGQGRRRSSARRSRRTRWRWSTSSPTPRRR